MAMCSVALCGMVKGHSIKSFSIRAYFHPCIREKIGVIVGHALFH